MPRFYFDKVYKARNNKRSLFGSTMSLCLQIKCSKHITNAAQPHIKCVRASPIPPTKIKKGVYAPFFYFIFFVDIYLFCATILL